MLDRIFADNKKLSKKYSCFTLAFHAASAGVIMLFFLSLTEDPLYQIKNISEVSMFAVLYMGIFAPGLGYLLYNLSIKLSGPTKWYTAPYLYL